MDANDFSESSPKRQRTESPVPISHDKIPSSQIDAIVLDTPIQDPNNITRQPPATSSADNDMLDNLMQHVEAESQPIRTSEVQARAFSHEDSPAPASSQDHPGPSSTSVQPANVALPSTSVAVKVTSEFMPVEEVPSKHNGALTAVQDGPAETNTKMLVDADIHKEKLQVNKDTDELSLTQKDVIAPTGTMDIELAAARIDGIPAQESAQAPNENEGAEWEVDSSPYESSTDSSDDTSSDESDEEDADGDYAMLDPEEQARMLMQGDGGSDDEGGRSKSKGDAAGLKTANEQFDDVPTIPSIIVTEDMQIEELGKVEAVVENNVLITAKTSGEYQVLESGSLLCHKDRTIAGVVSETLGRVEQPLYTMRFASEQDIKDRQLEKGVSIFYVRPHSTFVFTQPLKAVKGSDASNIHDEEVGDEEMEFSDDDAEAEHKRQVKLRKQGRLGTDTRGQGAGRGRGVPRGDQNRSSHRFGGSDGSAYSSGSLAMNYDDVEDGEGYTPLARPSNLHEMTGPSTNVSSNMPPPSFFTHRGRGRGRGRGGRDRGMGSRGGDSRGRGDFKQQSRIPRDDSHQQQIPHNPQNAASMLPIPTPPAPLLPPLSFSGPFVASPISPLPQQQFNFSAGYQAQGSNQINHSNDWQRQQSYPQHPMPYMNAAAMQPFIQQQTQYQNQYQNQYNQQHHNQIVHQQQQQQQHQHQHQQHPQQAPTFQPMWPTDPAAVADIQRRLEAMRQASARGPQ